MSFTWAHFIKPYFQELNKLACQVTTWFFGGAKGTQKEGDTPLTQLPSMDRTDKFLLSLFLLNSPTATSTLRRWHLQSPGLGIFSLNTRFLPEFTPNPLRLSSATTSTQLSSGDSNPLPLGPGSALSAQPLPQVPLPLRSVPSPDRTVSTAPRPGGSHYTSPARQLGRSGSQALPPAASAKTRPRSALLPLGETHTEVSPYLPSNCWFLPPSLLSNVSRDRRVEAMRARESFPCLLPLGARVDGIRELPQTPPPGGQFIILHLLSSETDNFRFSTWHSLNISLSGVGIRSPRPKPTSSPSAGLIPSPTGTSQAEKKVNLRRNYLFPSPSLKCVSSASLFLFSKPEALFFPRPTPSCYLRLCSVIPHLWYMCSSPLAAFSSVYGRIPALFPSQPPNLKRVC